MSEDQTLSMANNGSENPAPLLSTEFEEPSLKDESITLNEVSLNSKELREKALMFLKEYSPIEETFALRKLQESKQLKIKFYKQSTFYGEVHADKKHGLGILISRNSRTYEGEWKQDQKQGIGAQKFSNGCLYKGNYFQGRPSGTGTYIWPSGERYDGQWLNGFKHGSGMWRGQKGDCYKGEWKFGKPDGYGIHTFPNGDTYEGQFRECFKHGEGIQRFSNGDMYKGSYQNGKPSGYGEYFWYNGSVFKGQFVNGLRNGYGVWKRGTGNTDRYQGNYRNDKKWGYGVYTWVSGNIYKGNYEGDIRNGYGEMFWKNGSYYKGNWVDGIQHGEGCIFVPTEGFKKGIFDSNVIVEVWETQLIEKLRPSKKKLKIMTEQRFIGKHKKQLLKTSTNKYYNQRQRVEGSRIKTSQQKGGVGKSLRTNLFQKQRLSQQRTTNKEDGCFFGSKSRVFQGRRRVNTSMSPPVPKNEKAATEDSGHRSRDRLLHSSFYLYKLNMRHNIDTFQNLKKQQRDKNGMGSILFMGKLMPSVGK